MEDSTVTLIVGLAGIFSTLAASALGVYAASKARTAPLREALYCKQIDLITNLIDHQTRIRTYLAILRIREHHFAQDARIHAAEIFKHFCELGGQAAAILPTESYVAFRQIENKVAEYLMMFDDGEELTDEELTSIDGLFAKSAVLARIVLGVDEFNAEVLSMLKKTDHFDQVAGLAPNEFRPAK